MRRNVVAVGMCVAAALAVAGSAVQVAAASPGGADLHASAGVRRVGTPAFRPGDSGMITGVVLGASGRPLAGACVTARPEPGIAAEASPAAAASVITARTGADGRYFFGGLKPGGYSLRYHLCAQPAGPAGATSRAVVSDGQLVRVAPVTLRQPQRLGAVPRSGWVIPAHAGIIPAAGHRLALAGLRKLAPRSGYGGISGRVIDSAGRPIEGICVMVHVRRQGGFFGVGTSAQGTYSFASYLRVGQYTVQFGSCGPGGPKAGNWAPQWYLGKYSQARAELVRVRAGKVTRGIDAVMRRGGTISGVVTGRGGARLSRVCVSAVTPDGKLFVAQARTVRGRYRIDALDAGQYRVYFDPACGYHATPYLGQWWPGAATFKASKLITVRLGAVTAHVNAALRVGGTIAGTVRFENSRGKPLAGICVFGSGLGAVSSVQPDAVTAKNGSFVLEGLPAGRYQLSFGAVGCGNNGNYLYYNDPHPIRVGLGRTAHVAVFMRPGAIISGTVTSAATGLPLAGICVFINDFDGDSGVTRTDGTFSIDQIRPGQYAVGFSGGCGNQGSYAPQWFPGRTESFNAARVTLQGGKLTSGINAAMRLGSGISGVVTSKAGVPLRSICVGAFTPHDASFIASGFRFYDAQTHHGAYQIENLAPGQYQVVFFSCSFRGGPGWVTQWYRSRSGQGSAGLLDVPGATTVTGVNAALARGGGISGTAMEPSGYADSFFCIFATNRTSGTTVEEDAGANPSGYPAPYSISGLAPGRYTVEFYGCDNNGFAAQWYNRKSSPGTANPVTVASDHVTLHISALLTKPPRGGGSISGRVTDHATGKPAHGICVAASSPAVRQSGRTDVHGNYSIRHLASGSYQLYFYDCRGNRYAGQARPGVIRVHAPNAVRGVNFAVVLAGSISGAVVGGSPTPAPRFGVCVTTVPLAGGPRGYAVTGRSGRYLISGLPPGRYHVYFDPVGCNYGALPFAPQWYSGQASQSTATRVTVTPGKDTTGINATLARDGTISGTVTGPAPASAPLTGICVQATPTDALARAGSPVYAVSQSGNYTLARLPPGQYLVSFTSGCGASGYAAQWWQDANSKATATVVTVAPGSVTTGIDAAMHS